jgi:hypothetical protein
MLSPETLDLLRQWWKGHRQLVKPGQANAGDWQ